MSAGFLREARNELSRATSNADAHKNVAKSQVRLASIEEDETEKKMKSLEPAPSLSHFLSMVGHSIWQTAPSNLGKRWRDKNVSLLVKLEDGQVVAEGSYEKNQLESALSIWALGTRENSIGTYHVTISGRLIGSVLVGKYAVSRVGKNFNNNGLIDLVPKDLDIVAVFEPENRSLRCLVEKELKEFEILY